MSLSGRTRVRVRPEGKGHHHHHREAVKKTYVSPEWVEIETTPVEPDAETLCDTRYLWRVPDDFVFQLSGQHPHHAAYVCEHQVEID